MQIEDDLPVEEFSLFLLRKGDLFEDNELIKILQIAINKDKYGSNKYSILITRASKSLVQFYPNVKIDNKNLIQTAILNCWSEDGKRFDFMHLVYLVNACDKNCKNILYSAFEEELDKKFNPYLYEELLRVNAFDYNRKNYFQLYSEYVNKYKVQADRFGKNKLSDRVFMQYILIVYNLQIDFNRSEFKAFTNLNEFETWLLNPKKFNYEKFEAKWLIDINNTIIIDRLTNNVNIGKAIEVELEKEFNPVLAELKYKYFFK